MMRSKSGMSDKLEPNYKESSLVLNPDHNYLKALACLPYLVEVLIQYQPR